MPDYLFPPPPPASLPLAGVSARYAVRRIFCVGRNYAAHAAEMGSSVDRDAPWYFLKSPAHLIAAEQDLPYPQATQDYQHEVELAVALGPDASPVAYGTALDMTRRDLQAQAKDKRRPWDTSKDVEGGAVFAPLTLAADFGLPGDRRISLSVNGALRQTARLSQMVWSVPQLLDHLATLYHLGAGDVILTGTPAGVAPVQPGDLVQAAIDGLPELDLRVGPAPV